MNENKLLRNLLFFLFLIILTEIVILTNNRFSQSSTVKDLQKYADEILAKCASSSLHQTCYDKEIPSLMDKPAELSMEEAFEVTRNVQEKDNSFPFCHVLGHNLSAKEVKKNPSQWKEVASRCPSGTCSNGCIHGGFQERFRAESFTDSQILAIKPDLMDLCERRDNWQPTGLEQGSCYHAIGHLIMYLTSANINKSIKLCEEVAIKKDGRDFSRLCFDGDFMQIFQPLEPEDFALIKGKEVNKDKVVAFCGKYTDMKKASCWSGSWPLFREELLKSPNNLVWFCSQAGSGFQKDCYSALVYILVVQMQFNSTKIKNYCNGLPNDTQGICFANAASRMIETDYRNVQKATSLCLAGKTEENKTQCLNELLFYSTYNFHADSKEFFELCNGLPDPWKEKCFNKEVTKLHKGG